MPPERVHEAAYHYPLMLDDEAASKELLRWFEGIEEARNMPWRKKWLDPVAFVGSEEEFGKVLEKRAYEVWVSEVSKWGFFFGWEIRRARGRGGMELMLLTRDHVSLFFTSGN